jgi:hypothetical protein
LLRRRFFLFLKLKLLLDRFFKALFCAAVNELQQQTRERDTPNRHMSTRAMEARRRPSPLLQSLVTFIVAVFVLRTVSSETVDVPATPHRCIHGHSQALQSVAQGAAVLDVEYSTSVNASRSNATSSASALSSDAALSLSELHLRSASPLAAESLAGQSKRSVSAATTAALPYPTAYPHVRIHFDVSHLFNSNHFCASEGSQRSDKLGGNVTCGKDDLFSAWKRDFVLHRLLPMLGSSVEQWLSLRDGSPHKTASTPSVPPESANRALRVVVPQGMCGQNVEIPATHSTKGVANTDFVVYVLAAPLHDTVTVGNVRASVSTSSHTIAWATYCAVERHTNRPLVAMMNFVPSSLVIREPPYAAAAAGGFFSSPPLWQRMVRRVVDSFLWMNADHNVDAVDRLLRDAVDKANEVMELYYAQWTTQHYRSLLHELLHALGFAPAELQRYSTKMPVDPSTSVQAATATPAVDAKVKWVVTAAKVKAAVQNWMNCTSNNQLPGAVVEQSGLDGTVGAHWERLQFHDDLMAGVLSPTAALSDMTLAFFDTLPYYRANRLYAEHPAWGYQAGCGFAAGACTPLHRFDVFSDVFDDPSLVTDAATATQLKYWCASRVPFSAGQVQCTSDRRAIGFCFAQGQSGSGRGGAGKCSRNCGADDAQLFAAPPAEHKGLSLLMEGCPIVEPYSNRLCDTPTVFEPSVEGAAGENGGREGANAAADTRYRQRMLVEDQGYYFGPYSRCFASSNVRRLDRFTQRTLEEFWSQLALSSSDNNKTVCSGRLRVADGGSGAAGKSSADTLISARCLQTRCVNGGAAVELRVGTEWIPCPTDGKAGIVAVPPASGYMGWVGCEPAVMYCGDAAQLQRPAHLVKTTPPSIPPTNAFVLPLYRVTLTFSMSLNALDSLGELLGANDGAARFRMALVNSDRTFQAALQKDLARHRARLRLAPFGALVGQRVVGAARLASASFALFAGDTNGDEETSSWSGVAVPLHWGMLVSADLEVVARDSQEAVMSTQAWLVATTSRNSATASNSTASGAASLSAVTFSSVAEWLSLVTCSAASAARNNTQGGEEDSANAACGGAVADAYDVFPTSTSVIPVEANDARRSATSTQLLCSVGNAVQPPLALWSATACDDSVSVSVVGPLDVSEQGRGSADLLEVAVVHLRIRLRNINNVTRDDSERQLFRTSGGAPTTVAKADSTGGMRVESWVTQSVVLLALSKDVSAMLGVSSHLVRVVSIRHSAAASSETFAANERAHVVDVDAGLSEGATPVACSSSRDAVDVGFTVSLPVVEEVPLVDREGRHDAPGDWTSSSMTRTWTAFTKRMRYTWQRQLTDLADGAAVSHTLCPLRHASAVLTEQQLQQQRSGRAGMIPFIPTCCSVCPVLLDDVVNVRAPQPGVSSGDLLLRTRTDTAGPWWNRRLVQVRGFTLSTAAVLGSILTAILLLLCACRHGGR